MSIGRVTGGVRHEAFLTTDHRLHHQRDSSTTLRAHTYALHCLRPVQAASLSPSSPHRPTAATGASTRERTSATRRPWDRSRSKETLHSVASGGRRRCPCTSRRWKLPRPLTRRARRSGHSTATSRQPGSTCISMIEVRDTGWDLGTFRGRIFADASVLKALLDASSAVCRAGAVGSL